MLKLPQFKGRNTTAKLIRVFDHLFGILNSRNPLARSYKAALRKQNEACWRAFFSEARAYIKGLKDQSERPILEGFKKTGFVGFLNCIASTKKLFNELVGQECLKYTSLHTS